MILLGLSRGLTAGMVALMLAGCGGDSDEEGGEAPEDAFKRQLEFLSDGQASRAYAELHPAQQAFIPEAHYAKCLREGSNTDIGDIDVKEIFDEESEITGTGTRAPSKAITAEVELKIGNESRKFTDTFHEFLVDGKWRFTVANGDAYKDGRCP